MKRRPVPSTIPGKIGSGSNLETPLRVAVAQAFRMRSHCKRLAEFGDDSARRGVVAVVVSAYLSGCGVFVFSSSGRGGPACERSGVTQSPLSVGPGDLPKHGRWLQLISIC